MTMSTIKDKYLLLLGILSSHDVHGYQLNQMLKLPANVIKIGKANAYQLLARLENKGYVKHKEVRTGNRPPKLVYSITNPGKEEFNRILRERLTEFEPFEYPDGVSLNFIGLLKPQETLSLLRKRQERLANHCKALSGFSDEFRASHPGIDFFVHQVKLENELLNKLVKKYQRTEDIRNVRKQRSKK